MIQGYSDYLKLLDLKESKLFTLVCYTNSVPTALYPMLASRTSSHCAFRGAQITTYMKGDEIPGRLTGIYFLTNSFTPEDT